MTGTLPRDVSKSASTYNLDEGFEHGPQRTTISLQIVLSFLDVLTNFLLKVWYKQTKVIGTEVIFVDPGVAQWGLKNILGTLFITSLIRSNCLD